MDLHPFAEQLDSQNEGHHATLPQGPCQRWSCSLVLFSKHFAGTSTENLIEAYSQLLESKLKLSLYQGNMLQFTNAICAPICPLIKAKETPSLHHYLHVLHGCMEAPNEEFRAFIFRKKKPNFRRMAPQIRLCY
jgi:hypothetical protein